MKTILLPIAMLLITSPSFAYIQQCATGMGGYDEVQKIQIYFEENGIYIGSSSLAGNEPLGRCLENKDQSLECSFHAPRSLRPYNVLLTRDKYAYTGTIDQAFRSTGYVTCWLPNAPDDLN